MRPLLALALVAGTLVGCASCRSTPVGPENVVDAGDDDACSRACRRLATLGCPECVAVCRDTEASGVVSLEPECVANVASCNDIDRCVRDSP
jgi:hypothetical protein